MKIEMRLLTSVHDYGEAESLVQNMRSRGIALYVRSEWRSRTSGRFLVYVCLDRQYRDATALLSNPDYQPENPVDVDAVLAETGSESLRLLVPWVSVFALVAVIMVAGIVWLVHSSNP